MNDNMPASSRCGNGFAWLRPPYTTRHAVWAALVMVFIFLPFRPDVSPLILITLAVGLIAWGWKERKTGVSLHPGNASIALALWCFVAYAACALVSVALHPQFWREYDRILLWGGSLLAGYLASRLLPGHDYRFMNWMVASLVLSAALGGIVEYFGLSSHSIYDNGRLRLFTMHPARLGLCSALGAFFCCNGIFSQQSPQIKKAYAACFVILCAFMVLSASRTIILFSLAGFCALCLMRFPRYALRIFALTLLLFCLVSAAVYTARDTLPANRLVSAITNLKETDTFKTRLPIWEAGWAAFTEAPAFGQGPRSYKKYHAAYLAKHRERLEREHPYYEKEVKQAHNIVLGRLAETGVAGAATFFTFYFLVILTCVRSAPQNRWVGAFLVYYLLIGTFDDPLFRINDAFVFLLMGLSLGAATHFIDSRSQMRQPQACDSSGTPR